MIQTEKQLPKPFIKTPALSLLLDVINKEATAVLVGGCVRDHLLNKPCKDIDIEVYGIDLSKLERLLSKHFHVLAVGKSFGVLKVTVTNLGDKQTFDVAMPRNENKEGYGHKGFIVTPDKNMSFEQAAKRRDFTINAMGINSKTNELMDPYGGFDDLKQKLLRHVSEAFKEDPLRVFRAAQFCARFKLKLHDDTKNLCISLKEELKTLSKERIFEEFKKLLLASKPSLGLEVLRETKALNLFKELEDLINCPQDKVWHPEGDVWIHSLMVLDQAALLLQGSSLNEEEKLIVATGALCHDFGKPSTTIRKDGRIKSPAHEQAGESPTISFLSKIGFPQKLYPQVTSLVKEHLKPYQLYAKRDEVKDGAIRRLASRVNIDHLLLVSKADFLGRTTDEALSGHDPSVLWLKAKIDELLGEDKSPKPILMGRHLIQKGLSPGVQFKAILAKAFDAQLEGEFNSEKEAIDWLDIYMKKHN